MTRTARVSVPLKAVVGLFLQRQHLLRPRQVQLTPRRLTAFANDTGGIQMDSINVVDRAHYLTLWSRFGVYDRAALDRLVYRRRLLFEYWAHAACLIPREHFTAWRRAMLDYSTRSRAWGGWLKKNRKVVAEVERAITERGPLGNADFVEGKPRAGGWWSWKPATHALDYLWMSGRTTIASRVHFQKRFDLLERVLPDALEVEALSAPAFRRWHLRQSFHALGAATDADVRRYLTFPRAAALEHRRTLAEALESGEVVEIGVETARGVPAGKARWFALASDVPELRIAAARRTPPARGTTLLTPFDSALWYRERAERLFGFSYRIEVYTPGPKRVHGYYVLPIFHDGHLIGRVDAKAHRAERWLEVKHVHLEPWFAAGLAPPVPGWAPVDREAALAGLAEALESLASFVGAERTQLGRVSPRELKPELQAALNHFRKR
ncbi:MAG TPA: crosslink repair DNA glycosylase YcaQ family protein [Polyangiaceae bacterium]